MWTEEVILLRAEGVEEGKICFGIDVLEVKGKEVEDGRSSGGCSNFVPVALGTQEE